MTARVDRESSSETATRFETFGDDVDVELWRRRDDDDIVTLALVPFETGDYLGATVLFEVGEGEYT